MQNRIKPFVKWAGGKGSLLNQLNNYYPLELKNGKIECYIEPFVGGGAVLIDILQNYDVKEAYAFDINIDLINSYNVIKNNVEELITNLKLLEKEYLNLEKDDRKKYFYNIRKQYNSYRITKDEMSLQKAIEFIFLNRTCFNGLYRVNKNGDFNVPMGNYKNPTICDEENLRALSELIKNVNFEYGDYKASQKYIKKNTFVYFDPPYRPLNITSGFTSYTKEDFDDENQKELALYYKELNNNNVKVMLSNSNPKNTNKEDCFFENIYKGFNINEVYAKRMINANSNGRGEISELLITNYESDSSCYGEIECIAGNTILKPIISN
ncbi:MAG: DNA adenine methylase [Clostridia bacterium]|jgi:DNA adenine methylase